MKVFLALILLAWGGVWYARGRVHLQDAADYARKHHDAAWAPGVEYSVAMIYYQRANYPRAQQTFIEFLTDYPTGQYTAHALLRLSEAAESNRDYPAAREALDRFLQDFPDHPDRMLAQKRRELLYNR